MAQPMKSLKAAVIGDPIAQSKSPLIHRVWMAQYGMSGTYDAIQVKPEALSYFIARAKAENFSGFNVTIPHKQTIMNFCDELSEEAKAIGAVNLVQIESGRLIGKNSDAFGFVENIRQHAPDFVWMGKTALVLGAGGAARAVLYGLLNQGVERIILTNRTFESAQKLTQDFGARLTAVEWDKKEDHLPLCDLLVNTTSLGMDGFPDLQINLEKLKTDCLLNDIVYKPLWTDLLKQAREKSFPTVTGIGMLLHQARPAFAAWTGIMPEVTPALEGLLNP